VEKIFAVTRLQPLSETTTELPNIFRRLYWDVCVNAILSNRCQNCCTYKNSSNRSCGYIGIYRSALQSNTHLPVVQTTKNTRSVFDQRPLNLTFLDNKDRNFAKRRRCLSVTSADKHWIQFCHFAICNRFQEQVPDVSMDLAI